jgi:hypothetical protein
MSHCIEANDKILVPAVTGYSAWHGLETPILGGITLESVQEEGLHFPLCIHECLSLDKDGNTHQVDGRQIVCADVSERPDIPRDFIHLNVPTKRYTLIENERVWEAMASSLEGVTDYKVSCVGTLGGLKRYFISVELGDDSRTTINGDEFHSHLNFITSHDGSMAFEAHDSNVRIVCQNTLNWSMAAKHNLGLSVHHNAKNTDLRLKGVEQMIQDVMAGRATFADVMVNFAAIEADAELARGIVSGYYSNLPAFNKTKGFSTKARNHIDNIVELSSTGRGNHGKSVYDIVNGATEFYTSGLGVGNDRGDNRGKQVFSSQFGTASRHKANFVSLVRENVGNGNLKEFADAGNRAYEIEVAAAN